MYLCATALLLAYSYDRCWYRRVDVT